MLQRFLARPAGYILFFPKQFTVRGSQFFLKMCPPFVSLLVSAHFHWPCSISINLSPRSVPASVRPFPLAMQHFCSFVSQVCHWPCSISSHLSPRSVIGGVRPFPLAMQHFYSFVSQVCHLRCPSFSAGDAHFYSFVSQVCHWPCSISSHLSPRPATGGVCPFLLAM